VVGPHELGDVSTPCYAGSPCLGGVREPVDEGSSERVGIAHVDEAPRDLIDDRLRRTTRVPDHDGQAAGRRLARDEPEPLGV